MPLTHPGCAVQQVTQPFGGGQSARKLGQRERPQFVLSLEPLLLRLVRDFVDDADLSERLRSIFEASSGDD